MGPLGPISVTAFHCHFYRGLSPRLPPYSALNPLSKGVAPLCIAIPIYVSTYLHLFISSNTASSQCIQPVIFTFYISIMVSMRPLNTSSTAACQPHLGFFATLRLLVLFWNSYSYSHLQLWDQKIQTGLEARESSY